MAFGSGLAPGTVFAGDYRVVRQLSAGGMGAVYVAEQISTAKERALKLMLPQLVFDPALRRRFEQEARIGARIESEHVVEVQAAGVDAESGTPYLVMELLKGEDLGAHVARSGPMALGAMLTVFEQLCHAMGAAHRADIVHRDLKPENVFLAQSMRAGSSQVVKVLDFGIAKLAAEAEAKSKSTASIGSPMWMAPEQTERGPVTPAADVWALGLIAFFVLTGKPYWRAANDEGTLVAQLMREVLFEPMPAASSRAAEYACADLLPPWFDAWFARCTARDPTARFADGTAVFDELARVAEMPLATSAPALGATQPALARPQATHVARAAATPPAIVSQPIATPSRRSVVGLAAVIVLAAGVGGYAWMKHGEGAGVPPVTVTATSMTTATSTSSATVVAPPPSGLVPVAPLSASGTTSATVAPTTVPRPTAVVSGAAPSATGTTTGATTAMAVASGVKGGATVLLGSASVTGKLAASEVEDVLRLNVGRFRSCYTTALKTNPTLGGTMKVSFTITATGSVPGATNAGSTVGDAALIQCVLGQFGRFFFPEPENGTVTVVFPLTFTPG